MALVLMTASLQASWARVTVPVLPAANGLHVSTLYHVRVRALTGQRWQTVPVLRCDVNTRRVQQSAFAEFDMDEPVVVQVVRRQHRGQAPSATTAGASPRVVVRPTSRAVTPTIVNDSTVEMTLLRPDYLSVEFGGERFQNLQLLVNDVAPLVSADGEGLQRWGIPALTESQRGRIINWQGVQAQDVFVQHPSLIYFGPGIHVPKDLPAGDIRIPSNCTVYLAPGAVVRARFIVDHAENVRIIGRGIVDHPLRGVEITYSENVVVDGLTFLNPAHYTIFGGESRQLTIRNIKSFSARSWSDGIDLMCCRQVTVDNCFLRTSDDCIALYNHRWWYWGGSSDIEVSRCTLWPDVAHPVNIGSHGDDRNPDGETLQHVSIHDCDIIGDDGKGLGLLAINCGDNNHIRNVCFSNIRAEGLRQSRPFDLRIFKSEKYNRAPGCCIDSILFSDIVIHPDVPDSCVLPSRVEGMKAHPVGRYTLHGVSHPAVVTAVTD